jgi:3-ketoacyl-CoA synthase
VLTLAPFAVMGVLELISMYQGGDLLRLWRSVRQTEVTISLLVFMMSCLLLVGILTTYFAKRVPPVYLLGYHCYKGKSHLKLSQELFMEKTRRLSKKGVFTKESVEFQEKVIARGGLGDETYVPEGIMQEPVDASMEAAREEAREVLFTCVEEALRKTNTKAQKVDILVVNCSLFNPTPSLSAMIVNRFKMRTNIITYNLAGMGCSAGVISIGLAQQLLQVHPNSTALVVSTENITQNWYFGNEKSMMIPNCLFRVGGAAIVLSNRRWDRNRAKYQLMHVVRTHMGQDDAHYECVYQQQDHKQNTGVYLSKNLMKIAGHALKANITTLGPLVLPLSEQILFFANLVARKVMNMKIKPYIPDFKLAFEHFCIHTGGRGVIDAIEKQLELTTDMVRPSRETLSRYGNISSSSIWYVLSNIETKSGVRRGERVWQIAFGSGFKCNSAVWKCVNERLCNERHPCWLEGEGADDGSDRLDHSKQN